MSASDINQGLSAIAREVLEDVRKEAEALITASETEAQRTLRAAKEEADKNYQTTIDQATAKAEAEKRKISSLTEVEIRNRLLQTKETLIDSAFEKAFAKLVAFTKTEQYYEYLLKLIEKTTKGIHSKSLIVCVNAKDRVWLTNGYLDKLSMKLHVELTLADEAEAVIGGCKIQTADGRIVSDNTLENRLQELKPTLRVEMARTLFGKEA